MCQCVHVIVASRLEKRDGGTVLFGVWPAARASLTRVKNDVRGRTKNVWCLVFTRIMFFFFRILEGKGGEGQSVGKSEIPSYWL